jgi:BRCA2 repeat
VFALHFLSLTQLVRMELLGSVRPEESETNFRGLSAEINFISDCQTENFQEENDTPKRPPATSTVRSSGPAGFSTASGKGVSVSAEALARARQIYENCQKESVQEIDHKSPAAATAVRTEGFAGFSTASGKNVAISSQALARAQNIFVEESIDQTKDPRTQVSSPSFKQAPTSVKVEEDVGHRKRKKDEESDSDRSPSPVLGKKKRNDSPLTANSHESGLTQTPLFMLEGEDPTDVAQEILTIRRRARQIQLSLIEASWSKQVAQVSFFVEGQEIPGNGKFHGININQFSC